MCVDTCNKVYKTPFNWSQAEHFDQNNKYKNQNKIRIKTNENENI